MEMMVELVATWGALSLILRKCSNLWAYVPAPRRAMTMAIAHGSMPTSVSASTESYLRRPVQPDMPRFLVPVLAALAVVIGALWGAMLPL